MATTTDLIYETKRNMLAKYPRFGSEIAGANIEYRNDLKYHTAATDGKNVFVDPGYFASLSEDERLFLIAHEIMHVKFMHMYRLEDKNGQKRDFDVWNTATDAIINANLERDGFTVKEGYVNRSEALNYTAEEFYDILMQEKEKEKEQKGQSGQNGDGQNGNPEQSQGEGEPPQEMQGDDHSLWEEAFKNQQGDSEKNKKEGKEKDKDKSKNHQNNSGQGNRAESDEKSDSKVAEHGFEFDEKSEFEANRKEKRERFEANRKKTQNEIRGVSEEKIELGDVGKSNDSIDWKLLVRREIDNSETIWSQRRSIAENNYAYRLEENDIEDEAETEVMIDVSGSVNLELVKAFLRELKPLVNESKLKVGCFNEKFWGMVDIATERDIDKFTIPREARGQYAWTEDWDLAVRSFSRKSEVNKFVFTDGYPCPGTMPKEDLKNENVIWLVYGNKNFRPCCGKVINISEKQLKKMSQVYDKNEDYER